MVDAGEDFSGAKIVKREIPPRPGSPVKNGERVNVRLETDGVMVPGTVLDHDPHPEEIDYSGIIVKADLGTRQARLEVKPENIQKIPQPPKPNAEEKPNQP